MLSQTKIYADIRMTNTFPKDTSQTAYGNDDKDDDLMTREITNYVYRKRRQLQRTIINN